MRVCVHVCIKHPQRAWCLNYLISDNAWFLDLLQRSSIAYGSLSGLIKTHLSLLAERIWASVASPSADVWPQLFCIKGLHVRGNQLVIQFGCDLHCLRSVIFHVTPCCTRYFNVLVIFMKKRPQAVLQRTPPVRLKPRRPSLLASHLLVPLSLNHGEPSQVGVRRSGRARRTSRRPCSPPRRRATTM